MPIAQSRMISLINAAEDYEEAWAKVRRAFANIKENLHAERISLQIAWEELDFIFSGSLFLSDPENTLKSVARESAHFKATSRRNERSAKWQKDKREGRKPFDLETVKEHVATAHLQQSLAKLSKGYNIATLERKPVPKEYLEAKRRIDPEINPEAVMKSAKTDHLQLQADTEIDFITAEPDSKAKTDIEKFLETEQAKQEFEVLERKD